MKVTKFSNLLIFVMGFLPAVSALAGRDGGGGNAYLCYKDVSVRNAVAARIQNRETHEKASTAVDLELSQLSRPPIMADLIDAQASGLFQLSETPITNKSTTEIYEEIHRADSRFWKLFSPFISDEKIWKPDPSGVVELDDATFKTRISPECLIVQIAYYDDTNSLIYYNSDVVALMDNQQRSALKVHEDSYRFYRAQVAQRDYAVKELDIQWRGYKGYTQPIINKVHSYSISHVNSDAVRPFVSYLMTAESFAAVDFSSHAKNIAVGLRVGTSSPGTVMLYWATTLRNPYSQTTELNLSSEVVLYQK